MWQIPLACAKYIGIFLLVAIIWFVSYCVFYGDDVKTKTKTVYFVVLSELVAVAVAFVFAAVYGHKQEWKHG